VITRGTLATALRVLRQLRRDPRTVAMLLFTPLILMALMNGVFSGAGGAFQRVGVPLLGVFPLISMFIVTAITMLRERTTGTLERLLTTPLTKLDLLLGYALAFGGVAALQATLASAFAFTVLDLQMTGPPWAVVVLAVLNSLLGMSLGLFVSAFARTEFQAVQFMPLFLMPQIFLSGLMAPRERMPLVLRAAAEVLPATYAYDALRSVARSATIESVAVRDAGVVVLATFVALALGALTLRRRTD
jgi:ABC-2 type transport system permease protein